LRTAKRYIKLYGSFLRISIMRDMQSRGNFFVGCLVVFCFPVLSLLFVGAIYGQTANLNGWTLPQYLVLVGTFMMLSSFVFTMFFKNIFELPEFIRKGNLDFMLLKPINNQFLVSTRYVSFVEMAQILPGAVLVIIGAVNLDGGIEWWRWLLYPVLMVCGIIITYSIWFMMVTPCVWWIKMDFAEFFFNLFDLGRYHPDMFGGVVRVVLTFVLPFGVVAATPADLLLNRLSVEALIWMVGAAALFLYASHRFWRYAQKRYHGASS
jgi:ABC-2 type transport system permease protein